MIPAIDDARNGRGPRERPWTAEHDAILLQLRRAGLTMPLIGERLRRTPNACSSRASRLLREKRIAAAPKDYLAEKIEAYMARIAKLNKYQICDLKRECYGWR